MDPAQFYTGLVADAYGLLKGSSADPARWIKAIRRYGEPALELGCGDGDPLLALRAAGVDVDGLDASADMIALGQQRAAEMGLEVIWHHATMQAMKLERRYQTIFLAGPTFTLLPDDDAAVAALGSIRDHLMPTGTAIVPLWIPPPTRSADLGRPWVAGTADAELRYIPVAEHYDPTARIRRTQTRYERVGSEELDVVEREWLIHWYAPEQFMALAEQVGLYVTMRGDLTGQPGAEFVARCRPIRI